MVGINKQLSEDWAPGVTDFTLKEGIIFIPNSFDADGQPEYWQGDLKLTFTISDDPMKNYLKLRGFSRPPSGEFLIKDFKYTGDDTYEVEKASDILFVARELFDTVKVKNSNSSFDISAEIAEVLTEYDDRFLTNDRGGELVCRITSDGDVYVKAFSISGQTVNLRDLKDWETGETGATFEIPTLAVGDLFELMNAYDVLPEGLEETVGYPTLGYVTKHIESSGSWIKFNKYDKPNKSNDGKLWITYYPLSDFSPEYPFWDKMNRHGTYAVEENIDFPIVSAQETELLNQFKKYLDPLITLTLVTKRPTVLRRGQEIVFSASRFPQGIFKVIDNKISTETDTGGNNNRGNRIQTITFANYSDNWVRIIANLKNRNDISKAKLAVNRKPQNEVDFKLTVLWGALSRSVSAPNTPENLVIVDYGFNYITISWDVVPDAIQYYIEIYSTSDLETLVTDGYANDNDFSADPLEQGEYLFKVYALNGWGTSDPATITQTTQSFFVFYSVNRGTRAYIYKNNEDFTNEVRLTSQTSYKETWFALSKDGFIGIVARDIFSNGLTQLFLIDMETMTETQLTNDNTIGYMYPTLNDDGSELFYTRYDATWESLDIFKNISSSVPATFAGNETKLNLVNTNNRHRQVRDLQYDSTLNKVIYTSANVICTVPYTPGTIVDLYISSSNANRYTHLNKARTKMGFNWYGTAQISGNWWFNISVSNIDGTSPSRLESRTAHIDSYAGGFSEFRPVWNSTDEYLIFYVYSVVSTTKGFYKIRYDGSLLTQIIDGNNFTVPSSFIMCDSGSMP